MIDIRLKWEVFQDVLLVVIEVLTLFLKRFLFLIIHLHHFEVVSIELIAFVEFLSQYLKPILEYLVRFGTQRNIIGIQLIVQGQMQIPYIFYEIENNQTMAGRILSVYELPLGWLGDLYHPFAEFLVYRMSASY